MAKQKKRRYAIEGLLPKPIAESTGTTLSPKPSNLITGLNNIVDFETQDYLENMQTRLPYGSPQSKEERRLLANAHFKYGNPSMRYDPDKRASFDSNTNKIYTNNQDYTDYAAELAHAKQLKDQGRLVHNIRGRIGDTFYEDSNDPIRGRYGVPGQLEHEAHSVIEPQLASELNKITPNAVHYTNRLKKASIENSKFKEYAIGGSLPRFDLGGYNPPSLYGDESEYGSVYDNLQNGTTGANLMAAGTGVGGGNPGAAPKGADIMNRLNNARKAITVGAGDVNRRLKDPEDTTGTGAIAGMGLQAGAQAINMIDGMDGKPSKLGGIASGAMSGASMGAAGGLPGMAVGAVIGGGLALLSAEKAKKEQAKADKLYMQNLNDQASMGSQQTLRNYASRGVTSNGAYAYGGNLPQYPYGGKPATMQDSLDVYNSANKVNRYYNKTGYYGVDNKKPLIQSANKLLDAKLQMVGKDYNRDLRIKQGLERDVTGNSGVGIIGEGALHRRPYAPSEHRKNVDTNKFYQREDATGVIDVNAPMQLYDRRIQPQYDTNYYAKENTPAKGNYANVFEYDPIAVKPWQLKTPKEKGLYVEKYGVPKGVEYNPTPTIPTQPQIEQLQPRTSSLEPITAPPIQGTVNPMEIPQVGNPMIHGRQVEAIPSQDPRLANDPGYTKYPVRPKDYEYNPARARVKGYAYGGDLPEFGKGGGIHIKKSHRGRFTAYKKRTGKTTEEALHSKDPHVRQMANFARNAKKWKHPFGGEVEPEYEVEGGEMIQGQQPVLEDGQQQQVASDMTKVPDMAPSHDEGGVSGAGGERVFSDRMKTANKKTYAKEAEELGKKKAKYEAKIPNTNEAISNTGHRMTERMDMKLDQLFNEQEMKKQLALPPSIYSSMPTQAYGGYLHKMWNGGTNPAFKQQTNVNALPLVNGLYNSATNRRGAYGNYAGALAGLNTGQSRLYRTGDPNMPLNYQKLGVPILSTLATNKSGASTDYQYAGGDEFAPMQMKDMSLPNTPLAPNFKPVGPITSPVTGGGDMGGATTNAKKNGDGIPWQYVDNLAAGIATANTPQLAKPYYDPAVKLNTRFDINPQLQEARNTRGAMQSNIRQNTVQGGAANSNMQQLYASSLDNANQLYAQKNNIENELKNKEILLNSGINSRNNDKRYAYDVENVKRRAGIQEDIVNNARNFALDQYTSARDAKTDARDLESIKQIAMANANSANYGYGLKAFADMYGSDHNMLATDIARLSKDSPNSPALAYLLKMQAANKK